MSEEKHKFGDTDMELFISRLLRYGVIIASAIVLTGCIIFLARHGTSQPDYGKFVGEPSEFRSVVDIISSVMKMSGKGLIEFGLLVLIAIPILRVVLSVISFAVEKDRNYVIITLIVLALLLYSLLGQQ